MLYLLKRRKWLHKAADAYGEKVNQLDNAWIKNGEDAIKASVKEWYVPSDAEMTKWRAGAIGAWVKAKGTFEPEVAKRVTSRTRNGRICSSVRESWGSVNRSTKNCVKII